MPQRAPLACRKPGCRGLVRGGVCSVCGPLRRHTDRDAEQRRGTTTERGYGTQWQKVRRNILMTHPLCTQCGQPADDVDHIIAISRGGAVLDADNLQPLCRSCHNRKTRRESRMIAGGKMGSEKTNAIIVCGPPGAGKTTYVQQHQRWGDLVVDVDALLAAMSGMSWYDKPAGLLPVCLDVRDFILQRIRAGIADVPTAWVITSEADATKRARMAHELNATVIVLEVGPGECARRIQADTRRNKRHQNDIADWIEIIDRWWRNYGRNEGETVIADASAA